MSSREDHDGGTGALSSFVETVTRELRQQIVSGRLAVGTRLTERSIAEEFGFSRVPVREALRILEGEGFVRTRSPRVRVVAGVDDADAGDLFDVRSTVETLTAARAAEHATDEQRAWLHAIVQEGQERLLRGELEALPGLNARLHTAIASAADSPMLLGLVNQIMPKVTWYYTAVVGERALSSWREHAELAAAIVAGDADEARHRMREHVAGTRFAYLDRTLRTASVTATAPVEEDAARSAGPATIDGSHRRDHAVWRARPPYRCCVGRAAASSAVPGSRSRTSTLCGDMPSVPATRCSCRGPAARTARPRRSRRSSTRARTWSGSRSATSSRSRSPASTSTTACR